MHRASVPGPFVLVGFSIGGLYGRLYAARYPEDVAGMVIVDHAFLGLDSPPQKSENAGHAPPSDGVFSVGDVDTPPALISRTPIELGIEDDRNFQLLPKRDQDLHTWAMSRNPMRPNAQTAVKCTAEIENATKGQPWPLGAKPLIVISTSNDSPGYQQLQEQLLRLSHAAKQSIAEHSTHMVIVDQPEIIITAIDDVVNSIRESRAGNPPARGSRQPR
ncbi:MAG TPA: alpha/beta hydrolase [Bryobacteraceae bacterium]|nr:alpha/beta hydrolase [Bryobacteraceae bacterium]